MARARAMITVAGFNTAIDRTLELEALRVGSVQRATAVRVRPGGKGLHVAQTIVALGGSARLVGLDDAAHADLLAEHLRARGVGWNPVRAPHPLRQCLAVCEADRRVTEILEAGETVPGAVRKALLNRTVALLEGSDALVLSGSLPMGFPDDTYAGLVKAAGKRGIPCLVDASGVALQHAMRAAPWLLKSNADEAATLIGHRPVTVADAIVCLQALRREGVTRPVVTLGALGAVALDGDGAWHACAPGARVRNGVGSGDCFLAALAIGAVRGDSLESALRRATAAGAANAENDEAGFAGKRETAAWLPRVVLQRVPTSA